MSNLPSQQDIKSGQAVYTKKNLLLYDLVVTKFSNRFAWKCSRKNLINFFKENISNNHLDVGVGSGYFLQKLHLMPKNQRIGLLDLNRDCLDFAKKKLHHLHPEIYQHNVFEPFNSITKKFDSVSMNYLLHCLPGTISQKAISFDHIKAVLNPGGKIFGSTILGKGVTNNWLANKLIDLYNDKNIFDNIHDDSEALLRELRKRFSFVKIKTEGSVTLFVAM